MNIGLRSVLEAGGEGRRHLILLELEEGSSSPSHRYQDLQKQNLTELESLKNGICTTEIRIVKMWASDGRRISSRSAANLFSSVQDFTDFSDVILDISALPRSIFYPLLAKLLCLFSRICGRIPVPAVGQVCDRALFPWR
jgi:hypothetical protein